MFSSGYRKFFVFLFLFLLALAAGSYVRWYAPLAAAAGNHIAGAWSVEKLGPGVAVSWNFDAPVFRNARAVTLEFDDGAERRRIPLNTSERSGTLLYTPQRNAVTVRLRIQPAGATDPEKTEVIRLGSQQAEAVIEKPKPIEPAPVPAGTSASPTAAALPTAAAPRAIPQEGERFRQETPVSIWRVRAVAPPSLTRRLQNDGIEVPVHVKIELSGRVRSASTRRYNDATEAALAKIAAKAAMQWKFRPLKGARRTNIYRESVIRFKFPKT